jgi:hypothetical protein
MEVASCSEMFVTIYQATWRHIAENHSVRIRMLISYTLNLLKPNFIRKFEVH